MAMKKKEYPTKSILPKSIQDEYETYENILRREGKSYLNTIRNIDNLDSFFGVVYSLIELFCRKYDYQLTPELKERLILKFSDRYYKHSIDPLRKQKRMESNKDYAIQVNRYIAKDITTVLPKGKALFGLFESNVYGIAKKKGVDFRKLSYILRKMKFPLKKKTIRRREYTLALTPLFEHIFPYIQTYWKYEKNYKDWLKYLKRGYHKSRATHFIRRSKIVPPWFFEVQPPDLVGKLSLRPIRKGVYASFPKEEWAMEFPLRNTLLEALRKIEWKALICDIKNTLLRLSKEVKIEDNKREKTIRVGLKGLSDFLESFSNI